MTVSYFFAVFPEDHARDLTHAAAGLFKESLGLSGRLVSPEKLHMTCHFIGRFKQALDDVEAKAIAVGDEVTGQRFDITFDHALTFEGTNAAPCVFASAEVPWALRGLCHRIGHLLDPTRKETHVSRPFRPHVTWLYSNDRIYGTMPMSPLTWSAKTFALASGVPGVAPYRIIRTWALG
jgi:2'-5' RNA ligase